MKRKKNIKESISTFRRLAENSPLEAPVAGNNRHLRYMSPTTRELLLKARMPEIMAFAEDRMVDPSIVAGAAEATMRMGRIPDLGMYGLAGDEALAVKDFLADTILNVAEDELNKIAPISEGENGSSKAKHLKLAADYQKLADFHKRRAKEEMDKGKIAKDDGRAHSSIKANAASEQHKTLAAHCAGLADYHQIKANEITGNNVSPPQYPAQNPKKTPEEPPQDAERKAPLEKTDPEPDSKGPTKAQPEEKPVSAELDDDDDKPEKKDDKGEKSEAADPYSMAGRQLGKKAGGAIGNAIDPKYKSAGQAIGGQVGSAAGKLAGEYMKKKSYSETFSNSLTSFRTLRENKPGFLNRTAGGIAGKIGGGLAGGAVGGPAGARIGSVAGGMLGAQQGITGLAKAAMPGAGANMAMNAAKKAFAASKPGLAPAPAPAAPAPAAPKAMPAPAPGEPPFSPKPPEEKEEQTTSAGVNGPLLGIGTGAFPSRSGSIMPALMRQPVKPPYTEWAGREDLKRDLDRKGFSKIEASRSGTGMPKGNPKADEEPGSKKERAADEVTPMEGRSRFREADLLDDLLIEKKKEKKSAKEDKDDPDKVAKKGNANNKIAPLFHNLGHKMDHAKTKAEGKKYSDEWAKRLDNLCKNEGGSAAADAVLKYSLTNPWVREQGFTDEASNLRRKWETAMSDDARAHAMDVSPTAPEPVVLTINKFIKMADK